MNTGPYQSPEQGQVHRALESLCLAARLHRMVAEPHQLAHVLGLGSFAGGLDGSGASVGASPNRKLEETLLLAARQIGLRAKCVDLDLRRLSLTPLPILIRTQAGEWVLLVKSGTDAHLVFSPEIGHPQQVDEATLLHLTGSQPGHPARAMLLASRESTLGSLAQFDFSWFIPSLVKHRRLFGEVMWASVLLQLFALITPLFFQVVMDKVLVHEGFSTLNVISVGLLVIMVFESVLSLLRSYVFSHTTSRMDVELGSRLFRHLLALPLAYFQARRVGDTVARVRELDSIRAFLTGQSLTLVLDVVFSFMFIAVMLFYSVPLTLIVLASVPAYVTLSLVIVPVLRRRLEEKFQRGADSQAMLVEAINGIQTIKASALEPQIGNRWDEKLAGYVSSSLRAVNLSNIANEGVSFIGKLVSLATLWMGAHLVIAGDLSIGMFIAFNMFAGRVAQPIMRLAQLWTEFQQVGISMARLADVLNTPTEAPASHVAQLPNLIGRITFDNLSFRYQPDSPNVLTEIKLDIHPGQVIGIVGRSGSGKSTLTKLVQRLYVPSAGRMLIDGLDIGHLDAAQLRRQIGVVLQENWLFNRSIRDNIAIADAGAPLDRIVAVAKLAGAHDFISELPHGYDTLVGEHGANLSGGQKQRIAIARALFGNPKILIFDEATSALDSESEAIIHRNMSAICKGRTVLIIAHRLSAVRAANGIVVLDKGRIVEGGTHEALMAKNGSYASLWRMQSGSGMPKADVDALSTLALEGSPS